MNPIVNWSSNVAGFKGAHRSMMAGVLAVVISVPAAPVAVFVGGIRIARTFTDVPLANAFRDVPVASAFTDIPLARTLEE